MPADGRSKVAPQLDAVDHQAVGMVEELDDVDPDGGGRSPLLVLSDVSRHVGRASNRYRPPPR